MADLGIVVVHDDAYVVEQIAAGLETEPGLYVASTSLGTASHGQVVVIGGEALVTYRHEGSPVVALAGAEFGRAARAALAAKAHDIVCWPSEASRLPGAIRRAAAGLGVAARAQRGTVVAVAGARGGVGTSTLCAAVAALNAGVVLDLDPSSPGQRMFGPDEISRTLDDLPVDVSTDGLDSVLLEHAGGARCAHMAKRSRPIPVAAVNGLLVAARELSDLTIVDCGRADADGARAAMANADRVIVVVGNDVASVRDARAVHRDASYIIRRIRRDGVALRDAIAALGVEPLGVVRQSRRVARAADLGRLCVDPFKDIARAVSAL